MKLVAFLVAGTLRHGFVEGSVVQEMDLGSAGLRPVLLGGPDVARSAAIGKTWDLETLTFAPPISNPDKILCVGLNYHDHVQETGREPVGYPTLFTRFADTQIGHLQPIIAPAVSDRVDYEGELAVIIGNPGRNIAEADAFSHVAGYACYNDASIRDWQKHGQQWTPGKNFPGTGPFGPWIVTADEVPDAGRLQNRLWVNGQLKQEANTSDMIVGIAELIELVSSVLAIQPGDVIASGTPEGVGPFAPGDEVRIEIEQVGSMSLPVRECGVRSPRPF